jgi:CHAT domain-containing protein/Tfp pilus assembly protein PilF
MGKIGSAMGLLGLLGVVTLVEAAAPPPRPAPAGLSEKQRKELRRQVVELNSQLVQRFQQGRRVEALALARKMLAILERLYPVMDYPDGHPALANSLNNMGFVLKSLGEPARALLYHEKALAMYEKLYPASRFKDGHPLLAIGLNNMGLVLDALGEPARALPYFEKALAMDEKLYPASRFKDGHPQLAISLISMGVVLRSLGQPARALPFFEKGLAMRQQLYPASRFKDGHPDLATSLIGMGSVLNALGEPARALPYFEKALAMYEKLYPASRFKDGQPDLATSLNTMGTVLNALGESARALPYYEKSLAMWQKLYPPSRFKDGHPSLAESLKTMGDVLLFLGEPGRALPHYEKALAMNEKLYPASRFKDGHPNLASSLHNMGVVLQSLEEPARALPYYDKALAMYEKLYPVSRFKDGHPQLAVTLINMGGVLLLGEPARALPYYEKALAMRQKLYPTSRFKDGHPDLATSLIGMGTVLNFLGEPGKALPYFDKALAMYEKLYPASRFKDGHPRLAKSLNNMGFVLHSLEEPARALPYFDRALALYRKQTGREIASTPEAGALAWLASRERTRDVYLSAALRVPQSAPASYLPFWHDRAAVFRLLLRRHESAQVARLKSAEASQMWLQLADIRRRVSRLLVEPGKNPAERDRLLEELETKQQQLERFLAKLLPELDEHRELAKLLPKDLADKLPARSALVDLVHYAHFEKGKFARYRYVAFVVAPGQPVRRVPLGDASTIDGAVTSWRQGIMRRETSTAPALLRKLVWSKVEAVLPAGTQAIYLCSDGDLARLPFAALPGRKEGTILLEEYRLASVPSGLWLLHQLRKPGKPLGSDSTVLTVGGVDFGKAPVGQQEYKALPNTAGEVQRVLDSFGLPLDRNLGGKLATVAAVLEGLPIVNVAHFATHGEFREEELNREYKRIEQFRQRIRNEDWQPSEQGTQRVGLAVQNPLGFVGVVLSGGNDQARAEGGGILTGLQILEQPLQKMRLCVLSACETGLGRYTQGEGTAGLQWAFHVAGCRNVVASLWKVDDAATVALMSQFYHELRANKKTPLEALRLAQLTIHRHPERIKDLAGLRGRPAREKAVKLGAAATGTAKAKEHRAEPLLWAAFVLSGAGD